MKIVKNAASRLAGGVLNRVLQLEEKVFENYSRTEKAQPFLCVGQNDPKIN